MKSVDDYSDPAELRQLMANARRLGKDDVYWKAFSRLCSLSGRHENDPVERDFLVTLTAYEEILTLKNGRKTLANRTRQKLSRRGIIQCLEDWAFQSTSDGFELLTRQKLYTLTGEYLVLKYSDRFTPAAVQKAREKLMERGFSQSLNS